MVPNWISRAVCLAAVFLAACGGADPVPEAQPLRGAAPQRAAVLDATALMDWAEGRYPEYFPGHSENGTFQGFLNGEQVDYVYRTYAAGSRTTYLGVTSGGRVDVWAPALNGGELWHVGVIGDFTCQVLACGSSVSGTAATGAPVAGVTVTLKDSTNRAVTATTSVSGAYTLATTGMTGPFLLQLTTHGGTRLYGVTADLATTTVANLTPLTDLIVRSWYSVQGIAADTAFGNPAAAPPPTRQQTETVAAAVLAAMQLPLDSANAGIATPLALINQPFSADRLGLDAVLDRTSVAYGTGATVTVLGSVTQQTSVLTYDTLRSAIGVASTTVGGGNTTTSAASTFVPVQTAQATALGELSAMLADLSALITARRTAFTATDLAPHVDPSMLNDGLNAQQFTAMMAAVFAGGDAIALSIEGLKTLDAGAGTAQAVVRLAFGVAVESGSISASFSFRKVGGRWMFSGNQRVAQIEVTAQASTYQGSFSATTGGPEVNVSVMAPQGTIASVSASGGGASIALSQTSTALNEAGMLLEQFNRTIGPSTAALPPAGTLYTVSIAQAAGGSVSYSEPLNAFTTEGVRIADLGGSTLAQARLGETLNVAWELPVTYAVAGIQLAGTMYTGEMDQTSTYRCETPLTTVRSTATSGTLSIPATCNGLPVVIVNIVLRMSGPNGEQSKASYGLR